MNCTKNGTEHYHPELRPGHFLAQQRRGGDSEPATIVQQKKYETTTNKETNRGHQTGQSDFNCKNSRYIHRPQSLAIVFHTVPSGYPNPTRYPVFLSIPDPTRFKFRNHRVAGNPKHRVLPDISGKPEVSGTTRYSGYHP